MRIIFALETSGPGGAETAMLNLADAMRIRGHDCLVALPAEGWVSRTAQSRSLPWALYTDASDGSRFETVFGLRRLVSEHHSDVIHAHMFDISVYASATSMLTRVPLISTIHGLADIKGAHRTVWLKFAILRYLAKRAVFVSEMLKDRVISDFPIIRSKSLAIPNGIPIPSSEAQETGGSEPVDRGFIFGTLGNIRNPKGYPVLLDAVAHLKKKGMEFSVLIAGEPDRAGLYEALLAQREALGLIDEVEFLGHVSDIAGFLGEIDCLVSSSSSEGMPLSLMEAMSMGLPIVATRVGGVPELIEHERQGLLCEPNSPEDLAEAMLRVMTEPQLRDVLAAEAYLRAHSQFSIEIMCDRYERLYQQAIGSY